MITEDKFNDLYEKLINSKKEINVPVTENRIKNVSLKLTNYFVTSTIDEIKQMTFLITKLK